MRERVNGWKRDKDDWLIRSTRPGDRTNRWFNQRKDSTGMSYRVMGFVLNGVVYVRQPEHARAYDKARQ